MANIMNRVVFEDGTVFTTAAYPIETEPCIFDKQAVVEQQYREVLRITIAGATIDEIKAHFTDNAVFSIRQTETRKNDDGSEYDEDVDYPKNEFCILGDIVCHKDGKITVYMGKMTEHELEVQALEEENAELLFNNLTGEDFDITGDESGTDETPVDEGGTTTDEGTGTDTTTTDETTGETTAEGTTV